MEERIITRVEHLSSQFGMSRSTLYRWIDESSDCQKQERKVNMRDFFDLKQKCEQQEKMIEFLQNAPCTVNSSLKER